MQPCAGWATHWAAMSAREQKAWADAAPFVHPNPLQTAGARLWFCGKIAAGAVLLLPVRAMVLVFMLAAYIAIAWLLSLLASGGRPRTALRAVTSLFLRVGFFVGGVRLHIRGKREATGTIVSNHCSYLDVLIHAYLSFPSFVAKHGVKNVWYWGFLSRLLDCLYVAHARSVQDTTASKDQLIRSATDRVVERQRIASPDQPLLIFPEGTTTNGRCMVHFRRGAFVGGVPVQPVVLRYRYRHFSPTWESIPTSIHVFWLLASFVHDVDVIYLPTYTPTKMERQNPQTYADNMQRLMSEAAGVPAVQHTIDNKLRHHARILSHQVSWRDDPFYCSSCHRAHVSS